MHTYVFIVLIMIYSDNETEVYSLRSDRIVELIRLLNNSLTSES